MNVKPGFRKILFFTLTALLVVSSLSSAAAESNYEFFREVDVDQERFSGYERQAYYVPVEDGIRLALTVYKPVNGPDVQRFPVLLWYLPGHRESIDIESGTIRSAFAEEDLEFFTSRGYTLAVAEMRGSGASFGSREVERAPQIGRDGKALVDWIAEQPWSTGSVGMVGSSYQGFSQYSTAAERPKALKAIFPEIAGFDDYSSMFYPGGILVSALSEFAATAIPLDDQNYYTPDRPRPRLPSVPVIDEDGDGELADEIPLDKDGNGTFLNDGEPTYKDGNSRQHIYYNATRDHLGNNNLTLETLKNAPFRDSTIGQSPYTYADIDPGNRPALIAESGIAVYNRGGWFDYHARDTVTWFATLKGKTPTRLMMAPTAHGGFPADSGEAIYRAGPYFDYFGDTTTTRRSMNREKLRFFDFYLRGIDNGFDREPPVLLYVMGKGWRAEHEWPLARQVEEPFYLAADGLLSREAGEEGVDNYRVDFSADSRSEGANRWNYRLSSAREVMKVKANADKRISYTTSILAEAIEVTGIPVMHITLGSSALAGDVFVYLEDVGPGGNVVNVTEGQLRTNFNQLHPVQTITAASDPTVAVKPDFPWHRFNKEDYSHAVFGDDRTRELTIGLLPTSWVFKAGHKIRVSIAGADSPSFALHPEYDASRPPTYFIHRGGASKVVLPVIPE